MAKSCCVKLPRRAAEKHVADFLGVRVAYLRRFGPAADLLERPGNSVGQSGELHRRGVGQKLALPRDGALDQLSKKQTDRADHEQANADHQDDHQRAATAFFVAAATAAPRGAHRSQHEPADQGNHENPVKDADQADVQPHVAVENVAELVGHHALQLVTVEIVEASARDADHRVARLVSGGEGVDARLVLHYIDRRHRRAGSQRDFLDHVQQPPLVQVAGLGVDEPSAHHERHRLAARGELRGFVDARQRDDADGNAGDNGEEFRLPGRIRVRIHDAGMVSVATDEPQGDQHHDVDRHDNGHDGQDEIKDQPARSPPGDVLLFKKIHD